MEQTYDIEDIVKIQGVIMSLQATIQQPSPKDDEYLIAAASKLLEICTGHSLEEIERANYEAGLDEKEQPEFRKFWSWRKKLNHQPLKPMSNQTNLAEIGEVDDYRQDPRNEYSTLVRHLKIQ